MSPMSEAQAVFLGAVFTALVTAVVTLVVKLVTLRRTKGHAPHGCGCFVPPADYPMTRATLDFAIKEVVYHRRGQDLMQLGHVFELLAADQGREACEWFERFRCEPSAGPVPPRRHGG